MIKVTKIFFSLFAAAMLLVSCQNVQGDCDCIRYMRTPTTPVYTDEDINLTQVFNEALQSYASDISIINARHITSSSGLIECGLAYKNVLFVQGLLYHAVEDSKESDHYSFAPVRFMFHLYQSPITQGFYISDAAAKAFTAFVINCDKVDAALDTLSAEKLLEVVEIHTPKDKGKQACNNLHIVMGINKIKKEPILGCILNYTNTTTFKILPTQSMTEAVYNNTYLNLVGTVDFSIADSTIMR
jgi:hypothetical protein